MTAAVVLRARLRALGVTAAPDGDGLALDAPDGALTPALLAELRAHKPALLALLAAPARAEDGPASCACGRAFYGVAGRPALCPRCRRARDGEPGYWWDLAADGEQLGDGGRERVLARAARLGLNGEGADA